ncbi:hypothetical protein D3C83_23360 [compost metagenome]
MSEGMLGSNVVINARLAPAASASSSIASLGFRTGIPTAPFAASIAVPNAEQVNRIALAPQPSL